MEQLARHAASPVDTETRKVLRRGLESAADRDATLRAYQEQALDRLASSDDDFDEQQYRNLWENMGEDFLLRHTAAQIAAISKELLQHNLNSGPYVAIRDTHGDLSGEGATQIFIYTNDKRHLFAATVVELSKFDLDVVDATVATRDSGICFDTYTILDNEGRPLPRDSHRRGRILERLREVLGETISSVERPKRHPRQLRELPRRTEVTIAPRLMVPLPPTIRHRLWLLATIGMMLTEMGLQLPSAKITTLGERVRTPWYRPRTVRPSPEEPYVLENTVAILNRELGVNNLEQAV